MYKRICILFFTVIFLTSFILISCDEPSSPPTVTISISINPDKTTLNAGENAVFTAIVTASDGKTGDVDWKLTPADGLFENTKIEKDPSNPNRITLKTDEKETAESLVVTVTSMLDKTKSARAVVTVIPEKIVDPNANITVSINPPKSAIAGAGAQIKLGAAVHVNPNPSPPPLHPLTDVISWYVEGNSEAGTKIVKNEKHTAALTIDPAETADVLTIRAVADTEQTSSDSIKIRILKDLWIVGLGEGENAWVLPGIKMTQPALKDGTFIYTANVAGKKNFRFNISGTDTFASGDWFAPMEDEKEAELGKNEIFYNNENVEKTWVLFTSGTYYITLDPANLNMDVQKEGVAKLGTPVKPELNNQGIASWTALNPETGVTAYEVELFKDNNTIGDQAKATVQAGQTYEKDFLGIMRGSVGDYTVRVTAIGNGQSSANSEASVPSETQTVTQRPQVTGLSWSADTAAWSSGAGASGSGYLVKLFINNYLIDKEFKTNSPEYNFTNEIAEKGNGSYTFTVTALGNNALILDSPESDKSIPNVKYFDIWLVGIPDWTFPTGIKMTPESDGTFTWEDDVSSDSTFRFSLSNTTGWTDIWNGNWYAPAENNTAVTFNNDIAMKYFETKNDAKSSCDNAWTIPAGYYKLVVNLSTEKLRVEKPEKDLAITIHGPNSVKKGAQGNYTADITGKNPPTSPVITWTIDTTGLASGTSITNGVLTVAAGETKTQLIIRAAYTSAYGSVSGTKTVDISNADPLTAPGAPSLSAEGAASWTYTGDANTNGYRLQLYKGAASQGSPVPIAKGIFTHNFLTDMRNAGEGVYTFTVTALGDGGNYATSDESGKSNEREITRRPGIPNTPQAIWWEKNGELRWSNPDGGLNSGGTAGDFVDYTIQVYTHKDNVKTPLGVPKDAERKNQGGDSTWSDYNLAYAWIPAETGVLYSVAVTPKGYGLVIDAEPTESAQIHYTVFGNNRVWSIVHGGGIYVAGASNGKIAWSSDGITWTLSEQDIFKNTARDEAIRSIAYGKGVFAAVGHYGIAAQSTDGKTWTAVTIPGFNSTAILSVAFGGGNFVAAGDGGLLRYSSDLTTWNNSKWHEQDKTFGDDVPQNVNSITYASDRFVAVGDKNTVASSSDGRNWIYASRLTDDGNVAPASIAFGNNRIVILLNGIGDSWGTSDGINLRDLANQSLSELSTPWLWGSTGASCWYNNRKADLTTLTYDGSRFLAVSNSSEHEPFNISISTDGASWTPSKRDEFGKDVQISAALSIGNNRFILSGNEKSGGWGKMAIITIP